MMMSDFFPTCIWRYESRLDVRKATLHLPPQAGIDRCHLGATSIVMNGGYELNDDKGEYFYFCGQGGREGKAKDPGAAKVR